VVLRSAGTWIFLFAALMLFFQKRISIYSTVFLICGYNLLDLVVYI
jgi:hypothetical protein